VTARSGQAARLDRTNPARQHLAMVPARGFASLAIVALLLLASAALAQAPPRSDRILMRFEVFGVAGLHAVTNRTEIDEVGERYTIASDLATRGVAGLVVSLAEHTEVRGRLTADSALPEAFRSDIRRDGVDRHGRVDYLGDGGVDGSASPPPITPIAPAKLRGTVDNLTAYFQLERRLARGGDCTLVIPVYDGRLRYDLHYTDGGEQILSRAGGQRFAGATRVCRMKRVEIAGFLSNPKASEGAREGTIWYARLMPGDLLLPVRMDLETEIGTVTGYLAELHGRGVDLQLME
jgi:Protein of unknown function (DUF3108)